MNYIQENRGVFVRHVPSGNVEWSATHFQSAESLTPAERDRFGVRELVQVAPKYDEDTQKPIELDPVLVNDSWVQAWDILDLFDEEKEAVRQSKRRLIDKSLILERITDDQLSRALSLMSARQKERWRMPSKPQIYVDDPDLLMLLRAIGADTDTVLAA